VALVEGVDVQKSITMLVFSHLVAGDLTIDDPGENRRHGAKRK
jgi:hypothetical protein